MAQSVNLVGMGHYLKTVMSCHLLLLRFDTRILKLGDPSAFEANQVVMVVPPESALVETVAPVKIVDIQDLMSGQKF